MDNYVTIVLEETELKFQTKFCVVQAVNGANYKTDKGYINKNYCFCNSATTKVGDVIKVRSNFLQNYEIS